ncbi:MAG: PEP-CTERM sorting domain-containing protein [Planctomycetota bacterium]
MLRGFVNAAGIIDNVELTPIPEPATAVLLGLSGIALCLTRRRR